MEVSVESDVASALLLQKVKYMNVASMTILIFDYLLSLELEVSLVWGSRWSFSKIFYMCSRYPPFLDVPLQLWYSLTPNIDINMCKPIYTAASWGTFFGIATAEALLLIRTYGLMGCNPRVLVVLVVQYVVIACITTVILALFLKSLQFGPPPLSATGCFLIDGSKIVVVAFILVVFNETVLMSCTLWVGVTRYRHSNNHLIKTLYRDGITYFVLLFAISAGNLAILIWGPLELVDLFNTFLRVMHSVLSTRILLHVRSAGREERYRGLTSDDGIEPIFRIPGTTIRYTVN